MQAEVSAKYPQIDLTLAGHTHGMQFGVEIPGFKWSPVQYVYKEWAGLYQSNQQYLYVNRGYGYIGYPGRFGILPEITILTLNSNMIPTGSAILLTPGQHNIQVQNLSNGCVDEISIFVQCGEAETIIDTILVNTTQTYCLNADWLPGGIESFDDDHLHFPAIQTSRPFCSLS